MNSLAFSLLLSISPISELRGGIPYALAHGISKGKAFAACVAANIIIVLFLFIFLDTLHGFLLRFKPYKKTAGFVLEKLGRRSKIVEKNINRYGYISLALFVAVPLPITGAWSATFIAWLLQLERAKSFAAIAAGVIIAGIIVTAFTLAMLVGLG